MKEITAKEICEIMLSDNLSTIQTLQDTDIYLRTVIGNDWCDEFLKYKYSNRNASVVEFLEIKRDEGLKA